MKQEEKQQKMVELQIMNQQADQIRQQLMGLEEQMESLSKLDASLEAVDNEEVGKKMFSPLSSGVYIKTSLRDNKEVLVAVGAGVVVKKSVKDARDMIQEQGKKMELIISQMKGDFEKFTTNAMNIEKELSLAQ
tara:strand:+ start:439 stop:840 length:402 start_codon:yes stop_codon:yes gene_type:complete